MVRLPRFSISNGGHVAVIGPRDGAQREYECKCQRECDQYLHGLWVSALPFK
jgi:hypothetical protein